MTVNFLSDRPAASYRPTAQPCHNSITVAVKADHRVNAPPRPFIVVTVTPDIITSAKLKYDDSLEIGYDTTANRIIVRKAGKPTRHHLKRPSQRSKKFAVRFTAYPHMEMPVSGKNQSRKQAEGIQSKIGEFSFEFPRFE